MWLRADDTNFVAAFARIRGSARLEQSDPARRTSAFWRTQLRKFQCESSLTRRASVTTQLANEYHERMLADGTIAWVLGVIFVATVIRAAFGFGEALVAVPLLAIVIPVEIAAPLAVLVSITVAVVILAKDWRKVHF